MALLKLISFHLLALFVVGGVSYEKTDIILPPRDDSSKIAPIASLIFIQGADIPNDAYIPLAEAIQQSSRLRLWIGIPSYRNNTVNPLTIYAGIERTLTEMKLQGMRADSYYYAGHSLGGATLQMWVNESYSSSSIDGQILMGSFITRVYKNDYIFSYPVPTLTIGGELDGLARVTRIAESYYTQLLDPQLQGKDNSRDFPVTVCKGPSLPSKAHHKA